jgi:hypothetical protein
VIGADTPVIRRSVRHFCRTVRTPTLGAGSRSVPLCSGSIGACIGVLPPRRFRGFVLPELPRWNPPFLAHFHHLATKAPVRLNSVSRLGYPFDGGMLRNGGGKTTFRRYDAIWQLTAGFTVPFNPVSGTPVLPENPRSKWVFSLQAKGRNTGTNPTPKRRDTVLASDSRYRGFTPLFRSHTAILRYLTTKAYFPSFPRRGSGRVSAGHTGHDRSGVLPRPTTPIAHTRIVLRLSAPHPHAVWWFWIMG